MTGENQFNLLQRKFDDGRNSTAGEIESRFLSKVIKTNHCWLWQAAKNTKECGRFAISKYNVVQAHRFAYVLHNGVIPDGLEVCHSCDNPSCVNPEHLFLGTHIDNTRDRDRKMELGMGKNIRVIS